MQISNKAKINQNFLLEALLDYILPIFNKKIKADSKKSEQKEGKLEELVKKDKSGLKPVELVLLEDFIGSFLDKNKESKLNFFELKKNADKAADFDFEESKNNKNSEEDEIRYSVAFENKKERKENFGYSVEIKYDETQSVEKLSIKVKFENYLQHNNQIAKKNGLKEDKKEYSIELAQEKQNESEGNYSIKLVYESSYEKERLNISYKSTIGAYLNKRQQALNDFSDRVPGKHVSTFSRNEMPGVLGFTYLGQDRMALRDDLIGKTRKMVDIHESIHTPDEYETRILTDWIMQRQKIRYIR